MTNRKEVVANLNKVTTIFKEINSIRLEIGTNKWFVFTYKQKN